MGIKKEEEQIGYFGRQKWNKEVKSRKKILAYGCF